MKQLLLALSLFAVAFAACSGDDDDAEPTAAPTTSSSGAVATLTKAPAGTSSSEATSPARTPAASAQTAEAVAAIEKIAMPLDLADGQTIGKSDAKILLTVFEDFQCPHCLNYTVKFEGIIAEYVKAGKIRYEVKHLPILGAESAKAAAAAYCTSLQGRFWEMHKSLYLAQAKEGQLTSEKTNVGRFADDKLRQFAIAAGAEGTAYDSCYAASTTIDALTAQIKDAQTLGFRGTPAFAIDGVALNGSPTTPDGWRKLLDDAIAARK
ncbi:hypothetical protein AYO38_01065 [bacterium SCGC AG-212-C10]|nr:hypothetical protein AYO38_01065 [bacterium SCGC AG-212-C10]